MHDLLDVITAVRMGNHTRAARLTAGDVRAKGEMLSAAVSLLASLIDEAYRGGDVVDYLNDVVQPMIYI